MTDQTALDHFWAVIPAGGAGTRLWPLSRQGSPKFLHDLTGSGRTLIQATVDRLEPIAADRIPVVTGRAHHEAVVAQLPELGADSVIAEPSARDSMAAIGPAAALLEARDPDAVMGSFAADHVITGTAGFRRGGRHRGGGRAQGVAGDHRDRADPPGHRLRLHQRRRRPLRRGRRLRCAGVRGEAVERGRDGVRRSGLPLERRHVRGATRSAARPAGPT
ncbi:NTP transferase domain-containing protein [Nocardioides sp. B-3]|nr:NTP transferase domain-containing protein [Nocardioides sp. B-3]